MQRKLIFSYIIVILTTILISGVAFWWNGYAYIMNQSKDYYLSKTKLIADVLEDEMLDDPLGYQAFVSNLSVKYNIRITLLDEGGNVIVDSMVEREAADFSKKEEFKRAKNGEEVVLNRYSISMKNNYTYAAVPVETEYFKGILRTSTLLEEITTLNSNLVTSILVAIIMCFIVAIIVAIFFTRILSKPIIEVSKAATRIASGELDIRIYTRETDQIGRLAEAFNVMAHNLKENIYHLTKRNIELEAMLTSFNGGVVAINDANEILYFNRDFLNYCNTSNDEIKGKSLYKVYRHVTVFKVIDEVRRNGKSVISEGVINNSINIRVTATPLVSDLGSRFGVLLVIEDISKIRKLESMRRDFVSNVTHELKTPLTSIRGFIDTLKNGAIRDEKVAYRFLDIIDLEAERLHVLIQDILILSEIESKKEEVKVLFDINESIESVIELLEPKLTKEVIIEFNKTSLEHTIYCNPDRMRQLFINLLDNAIKYTESGKVLVTTEEINDEILIRFKDTGIGVDQEHLERIFERFYRVDKGRARTKGGTGLGLSIVKHIVELYYGTIEVKSVLNEGTEFILRFPVQR